MGSPRIGLTICLRSGVRRGRVRLWQCRTLRSSDPTAPPRIRADYLQTELDRRSMIDGIGIAREFIAQKAFDRDHSGSGRDSHQPGAFFTGHGHGAGLTVAPLRAVFRRAPTGARHYAGRVR
ncbi:GMC oxidoreductase [Bradyrhizobium sp. AZCC 2230]|uniref:GMC oxidoreductase n=1 Tax=Bradyrhizobium sp. AZCC 2230 TaxID=3117021 RepID=UPI002FF1006D